MFVTNLLVYYKPTALNRQKYSGGPVTFELDWLESNRFSAFYKIDPSPGQETQMPGPKVMLGSTLLVVAILLAALASNRLLDALGIANAKGLTIEQRKEKARRNQYEWNHFQYDK